MYAHDTTLFARAAAMEKEQLDQGCQLPAQTAVDPAKYTACRNSVLLIKRYQPSILRDYVPVHVDGDGNCLFRSISLAMYGSEDKFDELRVRTAIEIAMYRAWYDAGHQEFCAPFKDEPFIVCPSYGELCHSVTVSGEYADVMSVLALSAVTGCKIQMCFPVQTSSFSTHPLTRCLVGRGVEARGSKTVTILWTTANTPSGGHVEINHFVPLLKKRVSAVHADVVVVDSSCTGESGPAEHDVTFNVDVDAYEDQQEEEPASKKPRMPSYDGDRDGNSSGNGNGSCIASKTDQVVCENADNADVAECFSDVDSTDRFKTSEEVYSLLVSPNSGDILPDVPRGRKVNCSFVVDNKTNVQRKASNHKNRFWDDCGVWDTTQGRNLTSTYVCTRDMSGYSLQMVTERDNLYCVKRRINKKLTWQPLQPQPEQSNVVVLHSYYATLKGCSGFRKRITWLQNKPEVALIEYRGNPSHSREPHGLARKNPSQYVRTHPKVMDSMRVALEHKERPGQVYEQLVRNGDSFEIPRDTKQVKNLGQAVRNTEGGRQRHTCVHIKNIADDLLTVINGVQDNEFIQSVIMCKGKSPTIICYLRDQIADMMRFCGKETPECLRSVIGVDRTFNLGPCFVTTLVFKNMSVVRKVTNESPVFLGPVMFHFDAKTETYMSFFSHLASVFGVEGVHTELLADEHIVFGSDEERAIVNAIHSVFYSSGK